MLTLEWLHKFPFYLGNALLILQFCPFSSFHHFAHNLVISFETPLRPRYARSVKCQMHVKGNMSEPFPTLFFRNFFFFIYFLCLGARFPFFIVGPGVKCIGQQSGTRSPWHFVWVLVLAPGSRSCSCSRYWGTGIWDMVSGILGVVDCHFLRCGNLRLLIKKYTHRKYAKGIMRVVLLPLLLFSLSSQMGFAFLGFWLFNGCCSVFSFFLCPALCSMNIGVV